MGAFLAGAAFAVGGLGLVAALLLFGRSKAGVVNAGAATEHRQQLQESGNALAAAEAQTNLLQLALDALTSGVVVTDQQGKVLVRNRLAIDISDQAHEQSLIDAAVSALLKSAVNGDRGERQVEIFGPPARTFSIHAVPVTSDAQIVGALAVVDDVTDLRRIEKTRRDFVANLSHELRTPVGAASLLGEMLVDESDAQVRSQLTDRLLVETDRMATTIDDLLELSHIESHADGYDDTVLLHEVVEESLARTKVAAETSQIDVGSVASFEPTSVTGNRDQLVTAVVNLVENAIKYSSAGDSVKVHSRAVDNMVHLTVQDTGRGIPARDLDRVFERFYRVDRSRESSTGGTGIGLSIVRHVALNHGGTVSVTSSEGEGSTFTIELPRTIPHGVPDR